MAVFDDQLSAMGCSASDQAEESFLRKVFSPFSSKVTLFQVGCLTTDESRHFDVPGIFSRDLAKLSDFADKWYGEKKPRMKQNVSEDKSSIIVSR